MEIAVIGGGPAGATVARLLAEAGRDVVLLAGPARGRPRQAESLAPGIHALIDTLDLRERLTRAQFVRSTGRMVWWGGDPRVERHVARAGGYQVPREPFDALLLSFADKRRARIVPGARVRDADLAEPYRAILHCVQDGEAATITARMAIDCSGRAGIIARRGFRRDEPSHRTVALTSAWKAVFGWPLPDETHTLVEAFDEGWAWAVPMTRIERQFVAMVERGDWRDGGRGYSAAIDRTRHLRSLLPHANQHTLPWGVDASLYDATRYADTNLLLCGDAGSALDPFSTCGVEKALASAWLAAIVADCCLTRPELASVARDLYDAHERDTYAAGLARAVRAARDALAAFPESRFWRRRAETPLDGREPRTIEQRCEEDAGVRAALARLRGNGAARLRADIVRLTPRAVIIGRAIGLADAMVLPSLSDAARYVGGVNLPAIVSLVRVAPRDVPALREAYERAERPVEPARFLTALALLVANQALEIIGP